MEGDVMKAVILAGGKGTRLRPYTHVLPKPLMPLGEDDPMPIIEVVLRQLVRFGFHDVTIITGYLTELIETFCGDGRKVGAKISYRREVTPLGSHRTVKVDVRVVAATGRDLAAAVREGRFREDLLYRLDVLSIRMPPLRERLADIIPLAEHFLRRAAMQGAPDAVPNKALSAEAAQRLLSHPWPGNVRELRNVMERCHALVRHRVIGGADLDLALGASPAGEASATLPADWLEGELPAAVERLERLLIAHALAQTQGNRAETARRLGIHRQLLYRKLAQYGLD